MTKYKVYGTFQAFGWVIVLADDEESAREAAETGPWLRYDMDDLRFTTDDDVDDVEAVDA